MSTYIVQEYGNASYTETGMGSRIQSGPGMEKKHSMQNENVWDGDCYIFKGPREDQNVRLSQVPHKDIFKSSVPLPRSCVFELICKWDLRRSYLDEAKLNQGEP